MEYEDFIADRKMRHERFLNNQKSGKYLNSTVTLASRDWPFKNMEVGEVILFDMYIVMIKDYAAIYGNAVGKKFEVTKNENDYSMMVKRVK